MKITRESYPTLFKAILLCYYDSGMVNRLEPVPEWIDAPRFLTVELDIAEMQLKNLSESELDTFCTGEWGDIGKLIELHVMHTAHYVLQDLAAG